MLSRLAEMCVLGRSVISSSSSAFSPCGKTSHSLRPMRMRLLPACYHQSHSLVSSPLVMIWSASHISTRRLMLMGDHWQPITPYMCGGTITTCHTRPMSPLSHLHHLPECCTGNAASHPLCPSLEVETVRDGLLIPSVGLLTDRRVLVHFTTFVPPIVDALPSPDRQLTDTPPAMSLFDRAQL